MTKTRKTLDERLAEQAEREEELRRWFYRSLPPEGQQGLHGFLSEEVFGQTAYSRNYHVPVPATQEDR